VNEFDPPIGTLQWVEDAGVEDKHAVHLAAALQGFKQGRVVVAAQIAAKPHQAGVEWFVHDRRKIAECQPILLRSTSPITS
jgi:menaquinone-dependent protoporphyrinogen IX oxidase